MRPCSHDPVLRRHLRFRIAIRWRTFAVLPAVCSGISSVERGQCTLESDEIHDEAKGVYGALVNAHRESRSHKDRPPTRFPIRR